MIYLQKSTESKGEPTKLGEFCIRRAKPGDIPAFIDLGLPTCAFMHGRPDVPYERMKQNFSGFVKEHGFAEESMIYVAEHSKGDLAGQLWLHVTRNRFNGRRELWIWDITVHERYRRKGLGKQLLEYAKAQASAADCEELWLLVSSVNYAALQLYRSSGLRPLGQLLSVPVERRGEAVPGISIGATVLRPLASNDAEALHDLWCAADLPFRPYGRDSLQRLRNFLSQPSEPGWCAADQQDRLIGSALITDDGRKGWIERLAVHPDHRRAGMAKAIIAACTNSLKSRGILVIGALIENDNYVSRSLFESCGFHGHTNICYYSHREKHTD